MKKPCCSRNRLPAFLNWLNGFMDSWPILVCRFWRLLIISNYAEGGCCSKRGGPHGSSGRNFFQNKLKGKIFLVRTITIFDGKDFQRNLSLQSIHWEFKSFQLAKEWLSLSLSRQFMAEYPFCCFVHITSTTLPLATSWGVKKPGLRWTQRKLPINLAQI